MSSSCSLSLGFKLFPLQRPQNPFHEPYQYLHFPLSNHNRVSLSRIRCSNNEREETRWLREEQRWLREEERWLREESRWHAERESLVRKISALKIRIEEFEQQGGVEGMNAAAMLPEIGSGAVVPLVLEAADEEEEVKKRRTLRSGSEGDNVKEMQEALQKLGFYCSEEDVEFSSFSSGTERAVKTWQASIGAPEDGIMTAELQERLYTEPQVEFSSVVLKEDPKASAFPKEGVNGAAVASVTDISEIRKTIVEDISNTEIDVSLPRVFLLGENRWEEPSRLVGRNNANGGAKSKGSTTTCLSCRGMGRLLCAECDGSGEPNIEEQFLEWVDEGMKCPYCEGHGFTTCDVCDGKGEAVV